MKPSRCSRRSCACRGRQGIRPRGHRAREINLSSALQERGDWDRVVALQEQVYRARRLRAGRHAFVDARDDPQLFGSALGRGARDRGARHGGASASAPSSTASAPSTPRRSASRRCSVSSTPGSGRDEEAAPLFRDVYVARQRLFGDAHRSTARAARNLAEAMLNLDRPEESLALVEHALSRMPRDRSATKRRSTSCTWSAPTRCCAPASPRKRSTPSRACWAYGRFLSSASPPRPRTNWLNVTGWAQAQFEQAGMDAAIEAMDAIYRGSRERFGADHSLTLERWPRSPACRRKPGATDPALDLLAGFVERNERRVREGILASAVNRGRILQGVRERPHVAGYRTYIRLLAPRDPLRALEVAELTKARSLAEPIARPAAMPRVAGGAPPVRASRRARRRYGHRLAPLPQGRRRSFARRRRNCARRHGTDESGRPLPDLRESLRRHVPGRRC